MRAATLALLLLGRGAPAGLPHGASAEGCAGCHVEQAAGWRGSRHARSTASPVFEALLPRVEAAWGRPARERCVSCHAPGHGGDDAIGCVSCHGAVGNRGGANGALVVDLSAPLAAPEPPLTRSARDAS